MKDAARRTTTREAILDATDRLLARYGYRKMTIEDLANEVGIGKGSIYLHFSSKEELALSHIDGLVDNLKRSLHAIAEKKVPPDERLRAMLLERVMYRFDRVQHYRQSLDELFAVLRAPLLERRKRYFHDEATILAGVIREGQEGGEFREGDAMDLALVCVSATNSLLPYSMSAVELGDRQQVETQAQRTAEMLIKGLEKR